MLRSQTVHRFGGGSFFSDTLIAYTADDSWWSLFHLLHFARRLVDSAFMVGLPLRGAVSQGLLTVSRRDSLYVGVPIVDAYASDKDHAYRGVGVHLTAHCEQALKTAVTSTPVPPVIEQSLAPELLSGGAGVGELLVRHKGSLFVNHWGAKYTSARAHDLPQMANPTLPGGGSIWKSRSRRVTEDFFARGFGRGEEEPERKLLDTLSFAELVCNNRPASAEFDYDEFFAELLRRGAGSYDDGDAERT